MSELYEISKVRQHTVKADSLLLTESLRIAFRQIQPRVHISGLLVDFTTQILGDITEF